MRWWRRLRRLRGLVVILAAGLAASCARPGGPPTLVLRPLDTPAPPGSGQPSVVSASDGRTLLSWIEPAGEGLHRLRVASRTAAGGWSPPRTIAEGSGWFVNWADFPAVAALEDGSLFAHWLAKSGPATYAYDVHVSASRDGGRTWSRAVVPHRDGTTTEHGFVSMLPWAGPEMGLVWLDGRRTEAAGHGSGGAMALMHTTLRADGTLGPETLLDERVCDCCQTDAVTSGTAKVVVYRDRSDKEIRDTSVVRFEGGRWSPPRTLAADGWEINGCPVNGPAIAAAGETVAVAWFTASGGTARVKAAFSHDAGATFGGPIVVDEGQPLGRVDVVSLDDGSALVAWLEKGDAGSSIRLRHVAAGGEMTAPITVAASHEARSSGFPRMARSGREVTIAWRDAADPPRVRTAVVALEASR